MSELHTWLWVLAVDTDEVLLRTTIEDFELRPGPATDFWSGGSASSQLVLQGSARRSGRLAATVQLLDVASLVPIRTVSLPGEPDHLGGWRSPAALGDVDGDTLVDFAALTWPATSGEPLDLVLALSSAASTAAIRQVTPPRAIDQWLTAVPDLDGDGSWDVVIVDQPDRPLLHPTRYPVVALSGRSGRAIWSIDLSEFKLAWPMAPSPVRRRTPDGLAGDVAILAYESIDASGPARAWLLTLDGSTGREKERVPVASLDGTGGELHMVSVGDVSGDEVDDLAVWCVAMTPEGPEEHIVMLSGADGRALWVSTQRTGVPSLIRPRRLSRIADADGDGDSDLVVLGWDLDEKSRRHTVNVLSSRDAHLIRSWDPSKDSRLLGGLDEELAAGLLRMHR